MKQFQIYRSIFIIFMILPIISSCTNVQSNSKLKSLYLSIRGDNDIDNYFLDKSDDIYDGKFISACSELSKGNFIQSKKLANELVNAYSDVPESRMLLILIERRESNPDESWFKSFAYSWRESGYPQLAKHELYEQRIWESNREVFSLLHKHPKKGFLPYNPDSPLSLHELMSISNDNGDVPIEDKFLMLDWLDWLDYSIENECHQLSDYICRIANEKRDALVKTLSMALPNDVRTAVRDFITESSNKDTFDFQDVLDLDRAVSRKHIGPPRNELYDYYVNKYAELNISDLQLYAFKAMSRSSTDLYWLKLKILVRTMSTSDSVSDAMIIRMAKILEKLARVHLNRKSIIDVLIGYDLLLFSSKLNSDKINRKNAMRLKDFADKVPTGAYSAAHASLIWPIKQLRNEAITYHIENEIGAYEDLTGYILGRIPESQKMRDMK